MKPDPISDIALVRAFTAAKKTLPLADALRAVVEAARVHQADQLPRSIGVVVDEVSRISGQPVDVLLGTVGAKETWETRRLCWWVLHRRFRVSFEDIGRAFGGRHRTTICKTLDSMREQMVDDSELRAAVDAIGTLAERRAAA
jgi:chromosomal replication initiation ATPase DnaA